MKYLVERDKKLEEGQTMETSLTSIPMDRDKRKHKKGRKLTKRKV